MIVRDEATIDEALQMLESSPEGVRYGDHWRYTIVVEPERLESLCQKALESDGIAIVVPLGHETKMEDYSSALRKVKAERAKEEKAQMRKWVKEHPEEVKKMMRQMGIEKKGA